MAEAVRLQIRGALLERGGSRALRFFEEAARDTVRDLVEAGEQRLDRILRPRPAGVYLSVAEAAPGRASTGNYRRNINGRVRGLEGEINDGGVVYGPWLEGFSSRNSSTRFKGYMSFRKTGEWLERVEAPRATRRNAERLAARLRRS